MKLVIAPKSLQNLALLKRKRKKEKKKKIRDETSFCTKIIAKSCTTQEKGKIGDETSFFAPKSVQNPVSLPVNCICKKLFWPCYTDFVAYQDQTG